jgi:hypothetical protein
MDTRPLHPHFVYAHPDGSGIRVTIPAVLGAKVVTDAIETLIRWIPNALLPGSRYYQGDDANEQLAAEWPEYVLGPLDPVSFLCPGMPCSTFGV